MEFNEVSFEEVDRYLEITRKKGAKVLSVLGKITPEVYTIFGTEIGRDLLTYDINRAEELMTKVFQGTATDREKIILSYLHDERIPHILFKLKIYLDKTKEIKNVTKVR